MKKKIAIFSTHPIQYQVPLFRMLTKIKNVDLKVYFASNQGVKFKKDKDFNRTFAWNVNLKSGYKHKFIGSENKDVNSFFLNSNFIKKEIRKNKFDLSIIFGWNNLFYLKAIFYNFFFSRKLVLRSENNLFKKENIFKKIIKKITFYFLFKLFDKFLVIGKRNYDFYINHKINKKKLLPAPYCVDNDFFENKHKDSKKIKKKFNIKNEIIFIFSGKFIERKRPLDILKALKLIRHYEKNYKFIFIGDGILKKRCIKFCKDNKLKNVSFLGFKNQKQIVNYYCLSDVIVMPSEYETWGLSVNEAMAAGCACLISKETGCSEDLIISNGKYKNGFVFDAGDIKDLSYKIKFFIENKKQLKSMKRNSLKIVEKFIFEKTVNSIKNIIK